MNQEIPRYEKFIDLRQGYFNDQVILIIANELKNAGYNVHVDDYTITVEGIKYMKYEPYGVKLKAVDEAGEFIGIDETWNAGIPDDEMIISRTNTRIKFSVTPKILFDGKLKIYYGED